MSLNMRFDADEAMLRRRVATATTAQERLRIVLECVPIDPRGEQTKKIIVDIKDLRELLEQTTPNARADAEQFANLRNALKALGVGK